MSSFSWVRPLFDIVNHPLNRKSKIKTLLRLLWWKANQLTFKLPAVVELVPGRKIICYPDSSSGGLIIYKRLFDYEEMTYLLEHLKKESVFIDIGANIGDYSLIASSIITKRTIHTFEPFQSVLMRLKENIALNNIANIAVHEEVVSDKDGYEYFDFESESEVNHITYTKTNASSRLKCIKLDTFAKREKLEFIDFLKIDVEGAEMKVLKGAKHLLKEQKIKTMLLELNKNNQVFGTNNLEIINYLRRFGYKIYQIKKGKLTTLKNVDNESIINVLCKV